MYLIYGNSFHLIDEEINKIIKEETNIIKYDLNISSIEDIILEAMYTSMFQDKKVIIVKNSYIFNSSKTKKEDNEDNDNLNILYDYMNKENPLTTLIFTTYENIDMRKKVTKEFKNKYKIIEVGKFKYPSDLNLKVRDLIYKNKYRATSEVINYIIKCCNSNYDLIYNEVEKLFMFYHEPTEIKLVDAKNITSSIMEDNNFKFVESVINKDINLSLNILEDLTINKTDPIALLMLLAREYRLMLSAKLMQESGYSKDYICKELTLVDWQVEKLLKNASKYYDDNLKDYLKKLSLIDYKVKSGQGDSELELKTFLLSLI